MRIKHFCFIAVILIGSFTASAQSPVYVYGDIGFGAGYPWREYVRGSCLFLRHHQVSVGFDHFVRRAHNIPGNYEDHSELVIPFSAPEEALDGATVSYAWVIYPRKAPLFRVVLRAGVLMGNYREPTNYKYHGANSSGQNYTHDVWRKPAVGVVLDPAIEYTRSRSFGLTAGPYFVLNGDMSGAGLRVGMLLGKVGGHYRRRGVKRVKG